MSDEHLQLRLFEEWWLVNRDYDFMSTFANFTGTDERKVNQAKIKVYWSLSILKTGEIVYVV